MSNELLKDFDPEELAAQIKALMELNDGYASVSSIAGQVQLATPQVEEFLASSDNEFAKSLVHGEDGEDVYRLKTTFGALSDSWTAFRQLNAKKFGV